MPKQTYSVAYVYVNGKHTIFGRAVMTANVAISPSVLEVWETMLRERLKIKRVTILLWIEFDEVIDIEAQIGQANESGTTTVDS